LCGHPADTNEHALCRCTHHAVAAARAYARTLAVDAYRFADTDDTHHTGPALMDTSVLTSGPSRQVRAWFDPSRQLLLEVCPEVPATTIQTLETYCPLAGMLGIMPKDIHSVLAFAKVPGGWRRCSYAEIADRTQAVRLAIMRGCLHVWQVRYSQFVKWWWSDVPSAITARDASAAHRVTRSVNRAASPTTKGPDAPASKKTGPMCSTCDKPGHNATTCLQGRADPALPVSDADADMHQALPPKPVRLCSICKAPGHDKRHCPDKPVPTPGADGRHSSFAGRSPDAMTRTYLHPMITGAQESDRWEAEVVTLEARWLHDPPSAY
jgi:hypothetical protein